MRIDERLTTRDSVASIRELFVRKSHYFIDICVECKLIDVLQDTISRTEAVNRFKKECYTSHTIVGPMYNEEAFRYLLASESKRSVRSGYSFNILLIYSIDKHGLIQHMDCDVIDTVVGALLRTVRETDYIGWYLERRIVGAVLTVLGQDSEVEVFIRLQQRLMEIIRSEVSAEKSDRRQIRICQHHELKGIESEKVIFTVN